MIGAGTVLRVFVKICGTTNVVDAEVAVEAGADAVGVIFAPSRRMVDVEQAREIVDAVAGRALVVGVFRDHLAQEVIDIAEEVGLDVAQLHGAESPATSHTVHASVPLLFRAMAAGDPQLGEIDDHGGDAVLLDAPVPGGGRTFDWSLVGDLTSRHRVVLAGGLRPDNVGEAITTVRPWGVDVCSGVEAEFGRKDHDAVRRFVAVAREAGSQIVDGHPPLAPAGEPA